jgi:hypothetical protein
LLRISIDIIPFGNEEHRETLAVMDIINDGTGTPKIGNYKIKYYDGNFTDCLEAEIKRHKRLKGFLPLVASAFEKMKRICK